MSSDRSAHTDLLAPALSSLLLTIFYLPALCGAGQFMTSDGTDSGLAQMAFAAEWIRRGIFPLWNPAACFGLPHLAYAILSPLSPTVLLYVYLPAQVAAIVEIILLTGLAAAGWVLLGRRFGLSPSARLVVALLATAGNTSGAILTSSLWAMALLPFLFLLMEDLIAAPSIRTSARFAASFGFLWIWGAFPYLAYRFSLALAGYLILRALESRNWRPIVYGAAAFSFGVLLAAIQLAPFHEFLQLSPRADAAVSYGSDASVGWLGYFSSLIPGLMGSLEQRTVWTFAPGFASLPIPILALIPFGLATITVARRTLLIMLILSALLAAGHHAPFHDALLRLLPGYGLVRNHASWGMIFELCGLLLAGAALSSRDLPDSRIKHVRRIAITLGIIACLVLLAGIIAMGLDSARIDWVMRLRSAYGDLPEGPGVAPLAAHYSVVGGVISRALVTAGLYWLFCVTLIMAWLRNPEESRAYRFCFMAMLAMTMLAGTFRPAVNFFAVAPLSSVATSVAKWNVDRPERRIWSDAYLWSFTSALSSKYPYLLENDRSGTSMRDLPEDAAAYGASERTRILENLLSSVPPNVGMISGACYANGMYGIYPTRTVEYLAAMPGAQGAYTFEKPAIPWSALPGLAILVTQDSAPPEGFHRIEENLPYRVFAADSIRPRAERFSSWTEFPDSAALLADLLRSAGDTQRARILRSDVRQQRHAESDSNFSGYGRVAVTRENPNRVILFTDGWSTGLVVLRDAYAPDWLALVDGIEAEIITVDHAFRGVFVPPGRHEVEFRYDPLSIRFGALISGLAAISILGIMLYSRRK